MIFIICLIKRKDIFSQKPSSLNYWKIWNFENLDHKESNMKIDHVKKAIELFFVLKSIRFFFLNLNFLK